MTKKNDFSARVNEDYSFDVADIEAIDAISESPGQYHLLADGRRLRAELVERDIRSKHYTFRINGTLYRVQLADAYDRMVEEMGLAVGAGQVANDIFAPMPGLVLSVAVEEGQKVAAGDTLLILEAMKMENVIKAPTDAVIQRVAAAKGQAVDKGALLIELESE